MRPLFLNTLLATFIMFATPFAAAIDIQRWTTSEGTKILLAERHELPIVDLNIAFTGAGDIASPAKQPQLASFTAELLFSGTRTLNEEQLHEKMNDLAASFSSSSGLERSNISLRSLSQPNKLHAAIKLFNQVLTQPSFDSKILKRQQKEAITALAQNETDPDFIASRAATKLNYPNHPYGINAKTNADNIRSINRAEIQQFYRQHYAKNNAIVSIVGDLNRQQAEQLVQQALKGLPNHTAIHTTIPDVTLKTGEKQRIHFDGEQAKIVLTMPFIHQNDPQYYALIVGNYILGGGGFDGRLMKTLRDKLGYTYGAYSSLAPYSKQGPITIAFATKQANTEAALQAAHQIVKDFVAEGPTPTELQQAKANLIGSFPLRIDTNAKLLKYLALIGAYDLPLDYLDRYPQHIQSVTVDDVRRAWQAKLDPNQLNEIIVGKQSQH